MILMFWKKYSLFCLANPSSEVFVQAVFVLYKMYRILWETSTWKSMVNKKSWDNTAFLSSESHNL